MRAPINTRSLIPLRGTKRSWKYISFVSGKRQLAQKGLAQCANPHDYR
jgi:hypothetical protein